MYDGHETTPLNGIYTLNHDKKNGLTYILQYLLRILIN